MILVIGHGKMGKRHTAALTDLGYEYHTFELYDNIQDFDMDRYSHFIISSPNESHVSWYHKLKNFRKPILIEKPSVTRLEDIEILKDPLVSSGMSRRFHPITRSIMESGVIDEGLVFIQAIKEGPQRFDIPAKLDLGIHHVDLGIYFQVPIDVYASYNINKTDLLIFRYKNGFSYLLDYLNNRWISENEIIKVRDNSIKEELKFFLQGGRIDAYEAHLCVLEDLNDS